jgi:hypothetical protein
LRNCRLRWQVIAVGHSGVETQQTAAFVELLSLGFATIGVRATLIAVGGQLLTLAPDLRQQPRHAAA